MLFHDTALNGKTHRSEWIQAMSSLFNRKPNQTCEESEESCGGRGVSHDVSSRVSAERENEEEVFFDLDEDALSQLPPHLQNNMRELHLERMMRLATQNQYKTIQRPVNLAPQDNNPWSTPMPALDGHHAAQESDASSSSHWDNGCRSNVVPLETIVGLKIPSTPGPQGHGQYFTAGNATLCELETSLSCPLYMEILRPEEVDIYEDEQFGVPLCRSSELKNGSFGKKPSLASSVRIRVERSIHRLNKFFAKLNNSKRNLHLKFVPANMIILD